MAITTIRSTPQHPAPPVHTNTYNAECFGEAFATVEQRIQLAIDTAAQDGKQYVWIPQHMLAYNASLITFNVAVKMIREGGNPGVYDVKAYGAKGNGIQDDSVA